MDSNGDMADLHSLDVADGKIPHDLPMATRKYLAEVG